MHKFPWTKHPMGTRLVALPPEVGLTFIYGAHSFMGRKPAFAIREARAQSFVQVHVLEDCGHNLHYEKPEEFCGIVNKACELVDETMNQKDEVIPSPSQMAAASSWLHVPDEAENKMLMAHMVPEHECSDFSSLNSWNVLASRTQSIDDQFQEFSSQWGHS